MNCVFICQDEEGFFFCGNQQEIDGHIRDFEERDEEIDFKVIAKIKHPSMDLKLEDIEFYEAGDKEKKFTDKVILSIVNYLR